MRTPPKYDLSLIQEKVRLWHGDWDKLADPADVELLRGALTGAEVFSFLFTGWGHLAFMISIDSDIRYQQLVYMLKQETAEQTFKLQG